MDLAQLKQSTKSLKVLFAEDSLSARKITKRMLDQFFKHIDLADDGKVAYDMYRAFHDLNGVHYDIVFTDLEMPNMDGKELSSLIKDLNPDQEIVVLSGINDFRIVVELINIGAKKFISKPVNIDELTDIISQVITNIQQKKIKEAEKQEALEHNEYLRHKQEEHKALLEEKVKQLEEFSHALDTSAIVSKTDPRGNITYVNEEFCKLSGYSQDELIGKNNRIFKTDTRSSSYYDKLWHTITNKKTYKTFFENKRKDGSSYYIETTISPILGVDGEIVEFIAVSHDMTQLIESMEMLKHTQKSKEDFFVNISHEMKTPLNSILGFSKLLKKRMAGDEKSFMMLNTIEETGKDLSELIESIIDLRKIQDRSLSIKEKVFDPKRELQRVCAKYKDKALEKSLEYKVAIDPSIPETLVGDSFRIGQVLGAVIDNAIKFTPDGKKVHVSIIYDSFEKHLVCNVKDNGIGIAKEDQKKIFGLEQLDASANRSYEGAGIGLYLASNIMSIMKSEIKLKSILGKGSLFTLEFPVS